MDIYLLFEKYQKYLVLFSNTWIGKKYLSITSNFQIHKITHNSYHEVIKRNKDTFTSRVTIYEGSPYFYKFVYFLWLFENILLLKSIFNGREFILPHFLSFNYFSFAILSTTATFNPGVTAVDGSVSREVSEPGETFTTIGTSIGNTKNDSGTSHDSPDIACGTGTDKYIKIRRLITLFDSSSLSVYASLVSGTYSVYLGTTFTGMSQKVRLITSSPASNTVLATTDYSQLAGIAQSATEPLISSLVSSQYNDWPLDATGLSNVSKTSISKFGLRLHSDADGTAPTWSSLAEAAIRVNSGDAASNKPKLTIVYNDFNIKLLDNLGLTDSFKRISTFVRDMVDNLGITDLFKIPRTETNRKPRMDKVDNTSPKLKIDDI